MINEEQVKHIAKLAKLNIKEDELEKYKKQLSDIMSEIDKIIGVDITNEQIMISPTDNKDNYSDDVVENHISKEEAFKNAKRTDGTNVTIRIKYIYCVVNGLDKIEIYEI